MLFSIFTQSSDLLSYIDGGTGSIILQVVLAAGFATIYGFRGAVARVLDLVKNLPRRYRN